MPAREQNFAQGTLLSCKILHNQAAISLSGLLEAVALARLIAALFGEPVFVGRWSFGCKLNKIFHESFREPGRALDADWFGAATSASRRGIMRVTTTGDKVAVCVFRW